MLRIRFARHGKKNHATYRIIVSERSWDTKGRYIELLGHLDPHTKPKTVVLKEDRLKYWLSMGAQPSLTVHNLLIEQKIMDGKKIPTGYAKKKKTEGEEAEAPAAAIKEKPAVEEKKEEPAEAKIEEKPEEKKE
ncbi:MAG: 30S ribosomal protein S16 [Patescibacteria group bacterium]|jgi:small subunit ribosomal protein S16